MWGVVEALDGGSHVVVNGSALDGSIADGTNHWDIVGDAIFVVADV